MPDAAILGRVGTQDIAPVVRLLGPVQFLGPDGGVTDLPSASQRRLLAVLALHAPRPVRSGFLCQVLDITPGALRTSIARLRRNVGEDLLRTAVGGYRLVAEVDAALACEELEHAARRSRSARRVRSSAGAARRWRSSATSPGPSVTPTASTRSERSAIEDLAELRLTGGEPERAIQVLDAHVIEHPLRDRAQGLLMRSLACAGRQAEALRVFQSHRDVPRRGGRARARRRAARDRAPDRRRLARRRRLGRSTSDRRDRALERPPHRRARRCDPLGRRRCRPTLGDRPPHRGGERTADDGAGVVLVSGEVGIGKTTLLADFARRVADPRGWDVYYGRCDELVGRPVPAAGADRRTRRRSAARRRAARPRGTPRRRSRPPVAGPRCAHPCAARRCR